MGKQKHYTVSRFLCVSILSSIIFHVSEVGLGESTSPCYDPNLPQAAGESEAKITFSEYPLFTYITDQYTDLGILFGGDDPFIAHDDANPDTPVLSGYPLYIGDIEGFFVNPNDPNIPAAVDWFSLDAGYFDQVQTTRLEWFDFGGKKLGEIFNSIEGIVTFLIEGGAIASWRISLYTPDAKGYAIDNVDFGDPFWIDLEKTDDVNDLDCRSPGEELTYTICWENQFDWTIPDANIIDYLPKGVTYYNVLSMNPLIIDPNYDPATHTYTWPIGNLEPNDCGCVELKVTVNEYAEPGMLLHNIAEMWGTLYDVNDLPYLSLITRATEDTPICCWDPVDPNIIYVDRFAEGYNNGTCWADAYNDLQDAITRARESVCPELYEIRIANSIYCPGTLTGDMFEIPDNVKVYGGFRGGIITPDERSPRRFETILSGHVDEATRNNTVVTMGNNSILDGVTVEEAGQKGIDGSNVSSYITHCRITNNQQIGIFCEGGKLTVRRCEIDNNAWQGIHHRGNSNLLIIENCDIHNNEWDGVLIEYAPSTIISSLVYQNGSSSSYYGLNLISPPGNTSIRNNTIVHNVNEGIRRSGGYAPIVKNNIVYYNNDEGTQLVNISPTWCCVQNWTGGSGNINSDPVFAYDQSPYGYYHIRYESLCREGGDSGSYPNEQDMDGQDRVYDIKVDIGADEYSCEKTWHENDWTYDGVINYEEFAIFSAAWLSHDPNDPSLPFDPNLIDPNDFIGWNQIYNLDQTGDSEYAIDLADLVEFCMDDPQVWLWEACWREDYTAIFGMMMGGGEESMQMSIAIMDSLEAASEQEVYKPDPETLKQNIQLVLEEIEKTIETEEEGQSLENLYEIKAFLEEVLSDLQNDEN